MGGNVTLHMTDESGNTVVDTIDSSNAMTSGSECWELRGVGSQRRRLEEYLEDIGNEKHGKVLTLNYWTFDFKSGVFM